MKVPVIIEIIVWDDANVTHDAANLSELGNLTSIISCGIFLKENDEAVVIAQEHHHEDGNYRDSTSIPKVNIKKRKRIRSYVVV